MNGLHLAMAFCVCVMIFGAIRMGNKPWWDIVSGFGMVVVGIVGFVGCLFLQYA